MGDGSALIASNDRIGWLTLACKYYEFSFDGVQMGRYGCPNGQADIHQLGGVALSTANDLLVGASNAVGPLTPLELAESKKLIMEDIEHYRIPV